MRDIIALFKGDLDFRFLLALRQPFPRDCRKYIGNRLMKAFFAVDCCTEGIVAPDDPSGFIQKRIGNRHIPKQRLLYLPVLRCEADQLVQNDRSVIEHQ